MKKIIIIALILILFSISLHTAYCLGASQKQEDTTPYYIIHAICTEYNNEKNRTTFRADTGIEYYYYGKFIYTLNNLDYWLIMHNNHSDYLLDDWIVNFTPDFNN